MSKSQLLKPGGREACEQQDAVRMVNYEFSGLSFDLHFGSGSGPFQLISP
jgi:hypothetical protein